MTPKERSKIIEKRIAAQRPKLTKQQIIDKRRASMKRLKLTEYIATGLFVAILIYIQSLFPYMARPEAQSEALFNTFLIYWAVLSVYLAYMISVTFARFNNDNMKISEDKSDHLVKGLRLTWFAPLIALLIIVPSFISGVFIDNGTTTGDIIGGSFFMLVIAVIGSPLIAAFIVAPIRLLINGLVGLMKGDRSRVGALLLGGLIAGLTVFVVVGTMAVSPNAPYPIGSFQVAFAVLGIPGNYEVKDLALLWVVRGIALLYLALFIYIQATSKKNTAQ